MSYALAKAMALSTSLSLKLAIAKAVLAPARSQQAVSRRIGLSEQPRRYTAFTTRFDKTIVVSKPASAAHRGANTGHAHVIARRRTWCVAYAPLSALERQKPTLISARAPLRFVVDSSKSMASKRKLTAKLVSALSNAAESHEIAGYTTRRWLGGNSFKA